VSEIGRARAWLAVFVSGLLLSGATAFPLQPEVRLLHRLLADAPWPELVAWLARVDGALADTGMRYPFLAYGTDWLAFAHFVIAIAFWGPLRDPIRNLWVVDFGVIACLLVPVVAFACGPLRGIPLFWRLVDGSFGVFGLVPLLLARRQIAAASARAA
jgi:hypothetical protein